MMADGDPTPLGLISQQLTRMEKKQDLTNTCLTDIKVKQENHEQRLKAIESQGKETKDMVVSHIQNKDKHYNPYYSETTLEKLKRKKVEIGVGAGGGGALGTILYFIFKALGWM